MSGRSLSSNPPFLVIVIVCGMQDDDSSVVLDAITTGVGLAPFFARLDALYSSKHFVAALSGPAAPRQPVRSGQRDTQTENQQGEASSDWQSRMSCLFPA